MAKNNIVLYEPEIPQNSGNIMRTCAGTDTALHFIKPLGFSLDESKLRRSAVNYFEHVEYYVYENWQDFISKNEGTMYFLTRYGMHTPHELKLSDKDGKYYFVIGKESTGVPKEILKDYLDWTIRIPTNDKIRSLNISNVAAICIFEALRQQDFNDLDIFEPESLKGKDWLIK